MMYDVYDLQTIFIAHGPAFKRNIVIDGFENIELYNLLAGLQVRLLNE